MRYIILILLLITLKSKAQNNLSYLIEKELLKPNGIVVCDTNPIKINVDSFSKHILSEKIDTLLSYTPSIAHLKSDSKISSQIEQNNYFNWKSLNNIESISYGIAYSRIPCQNYSLPIRIDSNICVSYFEQELGEVYFKHIVVWKLNKNHWENIRNQIIEIR